MRRPTAVGAAFLALVTAASAQTSSPPPGAPSMTREQTFEYLSARLAEIQEQGVEIQAYAMAADRSFVQQRIDEVLETAVGVRDYLSSNPYVRVTGFSVTVPWGITFEFEFPVVEVEEAPRPANP